MIVDDRLDSLDLFRGATIAAMILVNNPGDWGTVFAPLVHSAWNGWTLADVVFPFFVFIMGCAMPLAFARRDRRPSTPRRAGARVTRRALLLIALGLVLNVVAALPHAGALRVPGVLQRIGLTYLVTAFVVRSFGSVTQSLVAAGLLVGHWLLMTVLPVGGELLAPVTREHNLAGSLDTWMFGAHTLTLGFDPEGLLGTAPTVATALLGALTGGWLRRQDDHGRQLVGLCLGGLAAIGAGLAWSVVWPINKPLWTGSYALFMSGLAAVTLAVCLYVVDMRAAPRWTRPFLWLGVNPLAIYFGSELVGHLIDRPLLPALLGQQTPKDWLYWQVLMPAFHSASGEWVSLLYAVGFVGCWIAVSAIFYRRGIRIRV